MDGRAQACGLLLAVIALLVGCGDDGDPAFKQGYERVERQLNAFANDVARTFNRAGPEGDPDAAPSFRELSDRAGAIARRLDQLDPPESDRAQVDRLKASFARLRRDLTRVVAAFRELRAGLWVDARARAAGHLEELRRIAAEEVGR